MIKAISSAFGSHPETVGESYLEHSRFAARTGFVLIKAGAAALVHAVFPFWCETTASDTVIKLARSMAARRGVSLD